MWKPVWIQKDESLWGMVEKYKYINAINGVSFYYQFCENSNTVFSRNNDGAASLLNIKKLSLEKLQKCFKIDFSTYLENFLSDISIFNSNLPAINKNLFFCKKCIASGFHSNYHQLTFISKCPYHLEEELTSFCPRCGKEFRFFNIGYKERPFSCQACDYNIFEAENLLNLMKDWKTEKVILDPLIEKLKDPIPQDIYFLGLNLYDYYYKDRRYYNFFKRNSSYNNVIQILNDADLIKVQPKIYNKICDDSSLPWLGRVTKKVPFKLLYGNNDYYRVQFHRDLYLNSKAIFKSVERFILKQMDKKTRREIKKSYNREIYDKESYIKHPFINWRDECYGGSKITFNKFESRGKSGERIQHFYELDYHMDYEFQKDILFGIKEISLSFKTFSSLYSKYTFLYLYNRYLDHINLFYEDIIYITTPGVIIEEGSVNFFV